MFNEVPVVGKKYSYGDWKLYAVHNDKNIKGFFGDYRWLSNFEPALCEYYRILYPSSENAYQAAKIHPDERVALLHCCIVPQQNQKKVWKTLTKLVESKNEWDNRKYMVMAEILFSKFIISYDLRKKLLDTGDKYLEETNHWHDNDFGRCICVKCSNINSKNMLGKILMALRDFFKVLS